MVDFMEKTIEQINTYGILPIATIENEEKAVPLAKTLIECGLPIIEVTLRTDTALKSIEKIAKECPDVLLGAGTVLNIDDAQKAIDAGAKFIVSPGFTPKIVEYCVYRSVPAIPGVLTPTEIQFAIDSGVKNLKLFPIESVGGLPYLKTVSAPFREAKFIPTGGINNSNLLSYLKYPKVLACAGTWILERSMINAGQFNEIASAVKQAVAIMLGFEFKHIGVNPATAGEAKEAINKLEKFFQLPSKDAENSIFVNAVTNEREQLAIVTAGYITLSTNFINRAIAYLKLKGIEIKNETRVEQDGKLKSIYLDIEVAGFAVQLVQSE